MLQHWVEASSRSGQPPAGVGSLRWCPTHNPMALWLVVFFFCAVCSPQTQKMERTDQNSKKLKSMPPMLVAVAAKKACRVASQRVLAAKHSLGAHQIHKHHPNNPLEKNWRCVLGGVVRLRWSQWKKFHNNGGLPGRAPPPPPGFPKNWAPGGSTEALRTASQGAREPADRPAVPHLKVLHQVLVLLPHARQQETQKKGGVVGWGGCVGGWGGGGYCGWLRNPLRHDLRNPGF